MAAKANAYLSSVLEQLADGKKVVTADLKGLPPFKDCADVGQVLAALHINHPDKISRELIPKEERVGAARFRYFKPTGKPKASTPKERRALVVKGPVSALKQKQAIVAPTAPAALPAAMEPLSPVTSELPALPSVQETDEFELDSLLLLLKDRLSFQVTAFVKEIIEDAFSSPDLASAARSGLLATLANGLSVKEARPARKRKVLIAGLLPHQIQEIRKEYGSCFNLRFWQSEQAIKLLSDNAKYCEVVLGMTGFIGHPADEVAKAFTNYTRISGGMTSLRDALTKLYVVD